ncbi:hypothetical protein MTP99_011807 [Tenebrio molitor]|nr:hypothetical protein MTP99_011807 [Tenebrio molitor]
MLRLPGRNHRCHGYLPPADYDQVVPFHISNNNSPPHRSLSDRRISWISGEPIRRGLALLTRHECENGRFHYGPGDINLSATTAKAIAISHLISCSIWPSFIPWVGGAENVKEEDAAR